MMTNGKDSAEVVKFLSLYTRLKDWCDDEPAIFQLAITDKKFKDLCMQLLGAAERLHASEQRHRHLFATPVNPKFLSAWRDFEARFEHVLAANWSTFVFGDESADLSDHSKRSTSVDRKWEHANLNAKIAADLATDKSFRRSLLWVLILLRHIVLGRDHLAMCGRARPPRVRSPASCKAAASARRRCGS